MNAHVKIKAQSRLQQFVAQQPKPVANRKPNRSTWQPDYINNPVKISGATPRTALDYLDQLILSGAEYPNAEHKTLQKYPNISQAQLQQQYDQLTGGAQ